MLVAFQHNLLNAIQDKPLHKMSKHPSSRHTLALSDLKLAHTHYFHLRRPQTEFPGASNYDT
jgi:hypothetical protein